MSTKINLNILHDKIFVFEKAIPNAKEMFEYFDKTSNLAVSEWQDWRDDTWNQNYGKTKSFHQKYWNENDCDEKTLSYLNNFRKILLQCVEIYKEKNNVKVDFRPEKSFAISVYNLLHQLNFHIDTPDDYVGEEHSILIYWTDDYIGGELYFESYPLELKPNAGDIIIFSSTDKELSHGTKLLTEGTKAFTIQMWHDGPGKGYVPLCKCEICLVRPQRCGIDRALYVPNISNSYQLPLDFDEN